MIREGVNLCPLAAKDDDGAGLVLAASRLKDCGAFGCGATFDGFGAAFDRFIWGTGVLKDVTRIVRSFNAAAISASSRSF